MNPGDVAGGPDAIDRGATLALVNARIGDTLLVTPALRALKAAWPGQRLVVRAHRKRAPVLAGLPFVDRVESIPPRALRGIECLARRRFDTAFCWSSDRAALAYCRRAARRVVAFDGSRNDGGRNDGATIGVRRPQRPMHAVDERLLLPAALGVPPAGKALAYAVLPGERAFAERWLARHGAEGAEVVGLALASFPGKAYRDWPVERFRALVEVLAAADPKLRFVVLGDRKSRSRAAALVGALPARVLDATGRTSLRETAALIDRLRLYVGIDTGPTHIAGALGVPMVAIYHCFHRGRLLAPLEHRALEVIEHPATDEECTRSTPMAAIGIEQVAAACLRLLAIPDPRRGRDCADRE